MCTSVGWNRKSAYADNHQVHVPNLIDIDLVVAKKIAYKFDKINIVSIVLTSLP
jgi:hypothetical protein